MEDFSHSLWQARLDVLKQDLQRVTDLLKDDGIQQNKELAKTFTAPLSLLLNRLDALKELDKTEEKPIALWRKLAALTHQGQIEIDAQLEILGGLGIQKQGVDDGFAAEAALWLNEFEPLSLNEMFVLTGRGPLLEAGKRIVRLPFLDWDYWHLPLLGRAMGLLAPEDNMACFKALKAVVEPIGEQIKTLTFNNSLKPAKPPPDLERLLPAVQELWQRYQYVSTEEGQTTFRENNQAQLNSLAEGQQQYLYHLFADMFATATLGPVYAIVVFVLDFDYHMPHQHALEDPDQIQIEGRDTDLRYLPAPVHRAAAILATLEAMDQDKDRPSYKEGPYQEIISRLLDLWREILTSARQPNYLAAVHERFAPWHEALFKVIRDLVSIELTATAENWQTAQTWYQAFIRPAKRPQAAKPALHILAGAMWLHRLDYPEEADNLLTVASKWPNSWVPLKGSPASLTKVVVEARLNRLENRRGRLEKILQQIPAANRSIVAGRFYRLLSKQVYDLERVKLGVGGDEIEFSVWGKTDNLSKQMRPLQREALEFLGGLVVHLAGLETESTGPIQAKAGLNICRLADEILNDYARQTGVNWNARTVLGRSPFLTTTTDIIRVRFPDQSVWNLPLMAHEFGHVTALATPAFRKYQETEMESMPPDGGAQHRHLDEFFADIFATYTFGPAFACNAILLQFNPAQAYLARGVHPTHDERVQVILAALERMNKVTCEGSWDEGSYGAIRKQLEDTWQAAVAACGVKLDNEAAYEDKLKETKRWGRHLFRIVDTFYRLGAGYKPERWALARSLKPRLRPYKIAPGVEEIYDLGYKHDLKTVTLIDLLNALWLTRAGVMADPEKVLHLSEVANFVCRALVGHKIAEE